MKSLKRLIAVLCALSVLLAAGGVAAAADSGVDYVIANPYAGVDWATYRQYKADLHSHTTSSDGSNTLKEMLEAHYDYGFDVVAVTDHGVVDYGWTTQNTIPAMSVIIQTFRDRGGKLEALDENGGTAANGNAYTVTTRGDNQYYAQVNSAGVSGQEMLRVPYGIENNPTSLNNAHVNSWFVDYGNERMGGTSDYITPIKNVDALGGLSVINHPGEYSGARDELYTADAYNYERIKYSYVIDKFAGLLTDYDSCLGIDVNSKGDSRTRFDRKLWDILLQEVVPTGRNVFAFATSDAHSVSAVYSGYTMLCMAENNVENLKECMRNGALFAASKYLGNYDEIKEIAAVLTENGNNPTLAESMTALSATIEAELAAGDQSSKYTAPVDVEAPLVTAVTVDENEDTITLEAEGTSAIRWIADGKLIATGSSIDLDEYSDKIGSYVRAELFGEGGIVYTQAFTLDYDGAPQAEENNYLDVWYLASAIPDTIVRFLAALPIFDWIWALMNNA